MLAGAYPQPSPRAGSLARRRCISGASRRAMLTDPRRRKAPGVHARRDADDAPEMPMELALIAKADDLRGLGDERAAPEQLPRGGDAEVRQIFVRWQPDLRAERANEMELVEPRVRREVVEADPLGERVV